jgi:hypothetical protein
MANGIAKTFFIAIAIWRLTAISALKAMRLFVAGYFSAFIFRTGLGQWHGEAANAVEPVAGALHFSFMRGTQKAL